MTSTTRAASLRIRMLGIVLVGAFAPMAVVGGWLATGARRSAETVLTLQLDSILARESRAIGERWVRRRSALLTLAEDGSLRAFAAAQPARRDGGGAPLLPQLTTPLQELSGDVAHITLRTRHGDRWVLTLDNDSVPRVTPAPTSADDLSSDDVLVALPLLAVAPANSDTIGWLDARLRPEALVGTAGTDAPLASSAIAVVDRSSGRAVVTLPFPVELMRTGAFAWRGEAWRAASRLLEEPAIELLAAVPATAFTAPFDLSARRGLVALLAVLASSLLITTLLTRRLTRSLEALAVAADAVTRGDLSAQVPVDSPDEVGRVGTAFNAMTASVRQMLRERSEREAVAAVGEFAASLAHEIRNPLSAVRLNLQHLEEQLPAEHRARGTVAAGLADIARLDRTVAGVLRLARSGRLPLEPLDLREPIAQAARAVGPLCSAHALQLVIAPAGALLVTGNAAALEQLFFNLLSNAAQASPRGGCIAVTSTSEGERVVVTVADQGPGFTPEANAQAFDAFFSTKAEGTGLGLTLAARIAAAHGGRVVLGTPTVAGARVRVELPQRLDAPAMDGRIAPDVAL